MASEAARARAMQKYYQPWLDFSHNPHPYPIPDASRAHAIRYVPQSSRDKALIAFAQLATLRLNVKRATVTLTDTSRQYILAEATRTLSLVSDSRHADGDELWFGNASIPRKEGVSGCTLNATPYTARDPDGASYTTAALVVPDMRLDARFNQQGFVGRGVVFYAGVPIISRSGHAIGAYSVTDPEPRHGLTVDELMFLHDMAITTLEHLETIKGGNDRDRGEQMVLGLGSFIEGLSTSRIRPRRNLDADVDNSSHIPVQSAETEGQIANSNDSDSHDTEIEPSRWAGWNIAPAVQGIHVHTEVSAGSSSPNVHLHDKPNFSNPIQNGESSPLIHDAVSGRVLSHNTEESERISVATSIPGPTYLAETAHRSALPSDCKPTFARAANILRESTGADGVIFFDASFMDLREDVSAMVADELNDSTIHADETATGSSSDSQERRSMPFLSPSAHGPPIISRQSSESERLGGLTGSNAVTPTSRKCTVLGLSVPVPEKLPGQKISSGHLVMDDRDLNRCIQRYPQGKVFAFGDEGSSSSSDDKSSEKRPPERRTSEEGFGGPKSSRPSKTRGVEGRMTQHLLKLIPEARNIVFWPLWDFSKERWAAGAFIWTARSDCLLNAQDDLSYLKAFGNSIMSEIARQYALTDVRAKSIFISSISHELRSPLHGILGGIEFLQDTAVDSFQSAMITSIEMCGKTLLDTVNHLLDYAKINHLTTRDRLLKGRRISKSSGLALGGKAISITADFDLATTVEEAVEAVHAGQTFRTSHARILHDSRDTVIPIPDLQAPNKPSSTAGELISQDGKDSPAKTVLIVDIEKQPRWAVTSQPGAIRRLVMNLLGNALKYTDKGHIQVSLRTHGPVKLSSPFLKVSLSVNDSGRGMSADFLRNHAFSPYTQEDPFADGTGLGLSIVRQIVDSLGGTIDLQSQKDVGTRITISLTLPFAQTQQPNDVRADKIVEVAQLTKDRTLCILDPTSTKLGPLRSEMDFDPKRSLEASLKNIAHEWFGMRVVRAPTMDSVPADFYIYAEPPPLDYLLENHGNYDHDADPYLLIMCTNSFEASALRPRGKSKLAKLSNTIEVFCQPCGPQKFARSIRRCVQARDQMAEKSVSATIPPLGDIRSSATQAVSSNNPRGASPFPPFAKDSPLDATEPEVFANVGSGKDESEVIPEVETRLPLLERKTQMSETETVATIGSKPSLKPAPKSDQYSSSLGEAAAPNGSPPVLVVDDNQINLQLLVAFVKKFKFPYHPAINGLEALEAYKKANGNYKYILMDISMPVMDGLTSTKEIRKYEKQNGLPSATVIALTGLASSGVQQDAYASGVDHFFPKPVRFQDLKALLSR